MRFQSTPIDGAWVVETEPAGDERGWFARTFDRDGFAAHGLCTDWVQVNASFNRAAGTLRGMHFQRDPHAEPKLVRCVRGRIYDVAVDVRPDSPTRGRWFGVELAEGPGAMLYLAAGLAHGYQTLVDDCELLYLMGHHHVPEAAAGVRWDDPALGIEWPPAPRGGRTISERDRAYEDFPPTGAPVTPGRGRTTDRPTARAGARPRPSRGRAAAS